MESTVQIFCCYAREDQQLLHSLKTHLIPFQRQGLITLWSDTDISPGTNWEDEINKHLNTAQIILLLVSPDFIASDYCYSKEMKRAMERYERGEARVIPIILRSVHWQETPFGKLQALPTGARAVKSWHNLDEAFFDVAEGILRVLGPTSVGFPPIELIDRGTADRKVDEARKKVQKWGERMVDGQWDWHLLGQALQLAHEAIENDRNYQRAWTFLADTYHRIGQPELALVCLKKSESLATLGPDFPGHFYKEVEYHITSGYPFNAAGGLQRQAPPQEFKEKYQRYLSL